MKQIDKLDLSEKKIIIFDMDGTLIDSIGIWNQIDKELIKEVSGLDVDSNIIRDDREAFFMNNTKSEMYLEYTRFLGEKYAKNVKAEDILKLRKDIASYYVENVIEYKPKADIVLNILKQNGYKLVLATSTTRNVMNIYKHKNKNIINKANILNTFDYIVCKDDVVNQKPHPETFLNVLNHYNVTPNKCVVFEDSLTGVTAAKKANIDVVCVYDKYSDNNREEINKIADYSLEKYDDLISKL